MPKFHVVCNRTTIQRVTLEVEAKTPQEAKHLIEFSNDADAEFEEVGEFDEGISDMVVRSAHLQPEEKDHDRQKAN